MAQRFVLAFCGFVACVAGTDVTASRWVCATFVTVRGSASICLGLV